MIHLKKRIYRILFACYFYVIFQRQISMANKSGDRTEENMAEFNRFIADTQARLQRERENNNREAAAMCVVINFQKREQV